MYDCWYKNSKIYWAHLRWIIRGVGKSQATQSECKCGAQRHNAKAWLEGHGKYGHLSDWLRQKVPQRYFAPLLLATSQLAMKFCIVKSANLPACNSMQLVCTCLLQTFILLLYQHSNAIALSLEKEVAKEREKAREQKLL